MTQADIGQGAFQALPASDYTGHPSGPLKGLRVLDLSRLVAGNILTQQLADMGADVVKVEPRQGDTLREWRVKGIETTWKLHSRNKRSLCIDFRHAHAMPLVRRLVPGTSVFVESFRPGTLERIGLAPETLLELEPKLVIVRISGWGQTGPYRQRPGFGTLVEGFSGFAEINGFADREPVLPPIYLADGVAGLTGAFAAMAALREVEVNGGAGQVIDLPLLDPLLNLLGPQAANYKLTGKKRRRTDSFSPTAAPRNVYRTRDDKCVCISGPTQGMVERIFHSIGRPDLIDHPDFRTNDARLVNGEALDAIIGEFVASQTLEENLKHFGKAEVTIGPINDVAMVVNNQHVRDRNLLSNYPDDEMETFPMPAIACRLSETPGTIHVAAPRLGQHTFEVLEQAGLSSEEIGVAVSSGLSWTSAERQAGAD